MHIRFFFVLLLSGSLAAGVVPPEALALSGTEPEGPAAGPPPRAATVDSTPRIETAPLSPPPVAEGASGTSLREVTTTEPLEAVEETVDFDVPIVRTPKIDKHVLIFTFNIRYHFELWLQRFERHRPMIKQVFAEFNLPADLIFLSLVESGFSTNAVSRAHAVGPWQFIKPTAKTYGLRVDNWIDERRRSEERRVEQE